MKNRICEGCGQCLTDSFRRCPNCGHHLNPINHTSLQISNERKQSATQSSVQNIVRPTSAFEENNKTIILASFGNRAVACLVDWIIVLAFAVIPMIIQSTINRIESKSLALTVIEWISSLVASAIFIGYSAMLHSSEKQATFGKRIFGLKLSSEAGEKITFGKALERSLITSLLTTILSFLTTAVFLGILFSNGKEFDLQSIYLMMIFLVVICLLPFSLALFDGRKKTLYDYICKTKVINVKII